MKILVEQEGIDVNAKSNVCFNNLIFRNNIWNFFKLFRTALIWASGKGHTEIVKILEGKNIQSNKGSKHISKIKQ